MLKASDVIGRQITVREGGQEIGKIKDLVIDPAGREVIGIVLSDGMFGGSRVASWKAVQAFGPDSVVIDIPGSVVKAAAAPEIKAVLDKKTSIKGLKLLTTKGKELGKITDFSFDETTGDVSGYELSSGLFTDTIDGTPFLPTPQWIELGKDVAFVGPEAEATIMPSAGGIKGVFKHEDTPAGMPAASLADTSVAAPPAMPVDAATPADAAPTAPGAGTTEGSGADSQES
jgi:uncharacterized protein YrrD